MNYYFGYGILREPTIINEILGYAPKYHGAILENYDLGYQILDQIPEKPRKILEKIWGIGFKAYTIKAGQGVVAGVIWELTEQDLELIKQWDFVGSWREVIKVKIKLFNENIIDAITTKVYDEQEIKKYVDSIIYENNLNPQGKKQLYEDRDKIKEIDLIRKQIKILRARKNEFQQQPIH